MATSRTAIALKGLLKSAFSTKNLCQQKQQQPLGGMMTADTQGALQRLSRSVPVSS